MLSGRLAWVTGAGGGIGRAVSQLLAQEGASIIVDDVDSIKSSGTLKVGIGTGSITHWPSKGIELIRTSTFKYILIANHERR